MLRSHARHVLAVVLIAGLLVPASAFSHVLYACKMSGSVVTRCPCPGEHQPSSKAIEQHDSLKKAECCELQASSDRASNAIRGSVEFKPLPALSLPAAELELPRRAEPQLTPLTAARSRAPPASRVPLYRKYCALLN